MGWDECKRDFVRVVEVDNERVESLVEAALSRLNRARKSDVKDGVSLIVDDYYEVVKELLIAYMLKLGFRSKNHQCLFTFFYVQNPELEGEAVLMQQMSFFRNRFEYYGEKVPSSFYEKNKGEFERIIKLLLVLVKKNVSNGGIVK